MANTRGRLPRAEPETGACAIAGFYGDLPCSDEQQNIHQESRMVLAARDHLLGGRWYLGASPGKARIAIGGKGYWGSAMIG